MGRTVRRAAVGLTAGALVLGFPVAVSAQAGEPAEATAETLQASTLRDAAASQGIFVGTAVNDGLLSNSTYSSIASDEFSSVTAENVMKWESIQPSQGNFNFAGGDRLVNFAQANDQQVWGHTLVWHSQLPSWVRDGGMSASQLRQVMNTHITTVMDHYEGDVAYWDVVNEAFNEDGTRRPSVFQTTLGDGYIAEAFRTADAADPNAKLCINDYNIEADNAKSDGMFNLVSSLLNQGVPIDCVGFQSHLILDQVPSTFRSNLERFTNLGLEVVITELDIRVSMPADSAELQRQSQQFASVTSTCLAVEGCVGVTVWGISDRDSWVPDVFPGEGAACLWDDNYQPKPAYTGMLTALGGEPGGGEPEPPTGCSVSYVVNRWNTGSVVEVRITTSTALNGWSVNFTLPAGTITNHWNAQITQSGTTVRAANAAHNANVAAGGSFGFGFQTNSGATYTTPTISLNGANCTTA
ncbi:endo-1,4-beta-xylanase [Streptomyces sp. 4N509B]|uniref:endo-1,4-beta-xylanase n=1 Tax=Streptomyces sp. 4N509B TaxID=3457413 RepID=UPI003FD1FA43